VAALKGTHNTSLFGMGRREDRHNVFVIHPRHNQQAVNYWVVAYTAVAYTAYMGNRRLTKYQGRYCFGLWFACALV